MDYIVNALLPDRDGLADGFSLPSPPDKTLARFADGAVDGIYIYHTEPQPDYVQGLPQRRNRRSGYQ